MAKIKRNSETICDDNGIEILVGYRYETSDSQVEECHGLHEVGLMTETTLTSVEVVIAGRGIDVLPMLTKKQKDHIIDKLNYE
jgi:hypothetical protein